MKGLPGRPNWKGKALCRVGSTFWHCPRDKEFCRKSNVKFYQSILALCWWVHLLCVCLSCWHLLLLSVGDWRLAALQESSRPSLLDRAYRGVQPTTLCSYSVLSLSSQQHLLNYLATLWADLVLLLCTVYSFCDFCSSRILTNTHRDQHNKRTQGKRTC